MRHMKSRMLGMAAVALLGGPLAAFASSDLGDFTNSAGTLSSSSGGLTLSGSELIAVNGLDSLGLVTGALGSVSFSTGALASGTLQSGGTFAPGGSFVIDGDGVGGIPTGDIFSGKWVSPVTWTLNTLTHTYDLSGSLSGTWYTGSSVNGAVIQLTGSTGAGLFGSSVTLSSGDTAIVSSVPEPATLALFGFGVAALGFMRRRQTQ
jgi:hypothetical protein